MISASLEIMVDQEPVSDEDIDQPQTNMTGE